MQRFRSFLGVFTLFFCTATLWAADTDIDEAMVLEAPTPPQCSADQAHSTVDGESTPCEPYLCDMATGLCMSQCDAASDCADDYICDIDCDSGVGQCRLADDLNVNEIP